MSPNRKDEKRSWKKTHTGYGEALSARLRLASARRAIKDAETEEQHDQAQEAVDAALLRKIATQRAMKPVMSFKAWLRASA